VQDPVAYALSEVRSSGLAGQQHLVSETEQIVLDRIDARRLSDALDAFDGNERPSQPILRALHSDGCSGAVRRRSRYRRTASLCSSSVAEKKWLPSGSPVATK